MTNRYVDMMPPVAASIHAGSPVIVLETGFFCRKTYPDDLHAMQEAERAIWSRDCVPCFVAVVGGRIKAGLTPEEMDTLCAARAVCSRVELPLVAAAGGTAAALPSAAVAIARLLEVDSVILPGLQDSVADLDALASCCRLAFTGPVSDGTRLLLAARGIPVAGDEAKPELAENAFAIIRELGGGESLLVSCGKTFDSMAAAAAVMTRDMKTRRPFLL